MTKLSTIEGIGPALTEKFEECGVTSVEKLLEAGCTKQGRSKLAETSGIGEGRILKLVNCADLMRVKGVGSEYSELLEAAGVDSIPELAQRNPTNLLTQMEKANEVKHLVRALPAESKVTDWVTQAKALPKTVQH